MDDNIALIAFKLTTYKPFCVLFVYFWYPSLSSSGTTFSPEMSIQITN